MSVETCLKMFIRPHSLSGSSTDYADKIQWKSEHGSLVAYNNSPFYLNLDNLKLNGHNVVSDYIPPMGFKIIKTDEKAMSGMRVSWQVINDYGGDSKEFTSKLD